MDFLSFEEFISIKEASRYTNVKFEHITEGNRLIDHIANINEESLTDFEQLDESEKYLIDNYVWEGIIEYATSDNKSLEEINEGIFSNLVSGVKNMSKRALKWAKGVLNNIGSFFKEILEYVKGVFKAVASKAENAGKKLWSGVKEKLDDKFEKKAGKLDSDKLLEEVDQLKETKDWIAVKALEGVMKSGVDAGKSTLKTAVGEDKEEAQKIEKRVDQEIKQDKIQAKKKNENYSIFELSLIKTINEWRKDPEFNMQDLINLGEYHELMTEEAESADEAIEKKKKSLFDKIKDGAASIQGIIGIICSGAVWLFEKCVEWLASKGLGKFSEKIASMGGPGAFKFGALSATIAVILGLGIEIYSEFVHGHGIVGDIQNGLHMANASYWLKKGITLAVPGASVYLKIITLLIVAVLGADHIKHAGAH